MKALFVLGCLFLLAASVFCQSPSHKLSPDLAASLQHKKPSERFNILLFAKDTTTLKKTNAITILRQYQNTALVSLTASTIDSLLNDKNISFLGLWRQPKEELTTGAFDLSLNKIALAHHKYPSTNGSDILVSIKEQRFDTTDIDWKGRYVNTGVAAPTESTHASIMATIIGGGAASSPFAKGVAWSSTVTSSDFATLLPDADAVYATKNVHLQNHSYGTAIENFYGADAVAYDASVYNRPTMVHVFSAGNMGTSAPASGTYASIQGFANLTGSFKMAKNSLTVGHTDSSNAVLPLSSRGPAYDGRIKPELVAFGEDGSSGAAALVSGTVALLQQAYKNSHSNSYPSAALVKAILLNSADDVGQKGPDYISGYGSLNAFAAMQTMTANHFFEDGLANNDVKTFPLVVPNNIHQVKLTLAWTDTTAVPNAPMALVNDLDATLLLPATGERWQPWVLNNKADASSLSQPAFRSVDTLNNVEQITIANPVAGNYVLQVKSRKIITADQRFAVAYQMDTANRFAWTYPTASDVVKAGKRFFLRWQTTVAGNGTVEYSIDGTTWQTIGTTALNNSYIEWTAPDTLTTALLRMRFSPALTVASDTFVISPTLKLSTGFNCSDSFLLYWNHLPTSQYQFYGLGERYLQPTFVTNDTFNVFQKAASPSLYYAVAPKLGGKTGLRSFAINYTTQGVGCYIESFFSTLQSNNTALLTLTLGTLYNVQAIFFQKWNGSGFQTIQQLSPTTTSLQVADAKLTEGINRYRVQIRLANGVVLTSDEDQVLYFPARPVIVYPNPAAQNSPVNLIVKDQGVYAVKLYDAAGRLVKAFDLNDIQTTIPSFVLSKGIYFVQVVDKSASLFTQKIIVY